MVADVPAVEWEDGVAKAADVAGVLVEPGVVVTPEAVAAAVVRDAGLDVAEELEP